jgi:hypothetical protein
LDTQQSFPLFRLVRTKTRGKPVCVYSVTAPDNFDGKESYGMLYFANILSFENELHSEIERILMTEQLVENWTYPLIQPKLIEEARRRDTYNFQFSVALTRA